MKTYVVHKNSSFIATGSVSWYIYGIFQAILRIKRGSCDMKFVRTEDLKAGMRLAKPIYNKKGVLLYERNSALTAPGIASAKISV